MEPAPTQRDAAPLAVYSFSGEVVLRLGVVMALVHVVFLGIGGLVLESPWPSGLDFLMPLGAALLVLVPSHEGLHTLTARSLGHPAGWKIKLPKVFTTVYHPLPRNHAVVVALAPLMVLNSLALGLFLVGPLRLFAAMVWLLNSVGSAGDIWLVVKLLGHDRDTRVLATDAGVEIWPGPVE